MPIRPEVDFPDRGSPAEDRHVPRPYPTSWWDIKRGRYVFLVHGFNTREAGARANYELFRQLLEDKVPQPPEIVNVYWPGDPPVSILSKYRRSIGIAESVAPFFADFLEKQRGPNHLPSEIVIVAHSLGCLLVLETLLKRAERPIRNVRRITIFLMAAAVPVSLVDRGGRLRPALAGLTHTSVLYSPHDGVLKAFRFGHGRGLPEAVGSRGRPDQGTWTVQTPMDGFGHNDYWGGEAAARHVAKLFEKDPDARLVAARVARERLQAQRGWPKARRHILQRRLSSRARAMGEEARRA